MARSLTRGVAGSHEESAFPVALVRLYGGEAATLALIVEEHPDGFMTVFVPQAPTPTLGKRLLRRDPNASSGSRCRRPRRSTASCSGVSAAQSCSSVAPGRAAAQVPADSRETGASETTE